MAVENENSKTPEKEKDLAQTPWWFIRSLEKYLGKSFDIDVCALAETAKCEMYYSLEEGNNSLTNSWVKDFREANETYLTFPLCWCNPPFSEALTWVYKVIEQAKEGATTAIILPNNPETEYVRTVKKFAEKVIEMPFRLNFLRPDGTPFLGKGGKKQGPKFSCLIALISPVSCQGDYDVKGKYVYHDFREGFYGRYK